MSTIETDPAGASADAENSNAERPPREGPPIPDPALTDLEQDDWSGTPEPEPASKPEPEPEEGTGGQVAEDGNPGADPDAVPNIGPALRGRSRARSETTERLYERSVRELYRRSERHRNTDPQQLVVVSPADVTDDLIASIPVRTEASWVLYRSALLWHLAAHQHRNEAYASAYRLLASVPRSTAIGISRPPTRAKRTIPHDDLISLLTELGARNRAASWGTRTSYWLLAALATGARPREWIGARWLDETHEVLRIQNGKLQRAAVPPYLLVPAGKTIFDVEAENPETLTPGDESDETRQFRNVPVEKDDRIWVDHHLRSLASYLQGTEAAGEDRVRGYEAYYHASRRALQVACKRAFKGKRSYSLYVMRSQFSANAKARMPLEDVSALMGHSNTRVTMGHYGSRKAAHGRHDTSTPRQSETAAPSERASSSAPAVTDSPVDRPDADRQ